MFFLPSYFLALPFFDGDIESPGGDIESPGGDLDSPGGDLDSPGGDHRQAFSSLYSNFYFDKLHSYLCIVDPELNN